MVERKIIIGILMITFLGITLGLYFYQSDSIDEDYPNYEAVAIVERVIDGDTLEIKITKEVLPKAGVKTGPDKIRLACIDTEELSKSEAVDKHEKLENIDQETYEKTEYYKTALRAKELLETLLSKDKKIYLDLDDLAYGTGPCRGYYGRLIGVIFLRRDNGWINVNARLIVDQYSSNESSQYPLSLKYRSEFSPYEWLEPDYAYL